MATTADIKIGMCIELDGKTFQIIDFQHVKPGKGAAFVRAVVDAVGHEGLARVFSAPEALPEPGEIADPQLWLDRMAAVADAP